MPKATKLHSKGKSGKPSSLQKPTKVDKDSPEDKDQDDSVGQFQLELCWCIQQLERSLKEKKGNEKQLQEAWKVLTVLKNNNQPMIRKRQLMRTHFGDYRAKMAAEEKKLVKMASKMKITENPAQPKATFLRKSAFLTTGDSAFRFNFNLAPEHVDAGNTIEGHSGSPPTNSNVGITNVSNSGDAPAKNPKEDTKNFKFTFSQSQFKFNFNLDNNM